MDQGGREGLHEFVMKLMRVSGPGREGLHEFVMKLMRVSGPGGREELHMSIMKGGYGRGGYMVGRGFCEIV